MDRAEIETLFQAVFEQCRAADRPLDDTQKQILLQLVEPLVANLADGVGVNPLDELLPEQRQALLSFIRDQEKQGHSWKTQLLNDWLQGNNSGLVQFIREQYGPQWLTRIQPYHLVPYSENEDSEVLRLKLGDRIEVCNGLWEWVQDDGPCPREWFPCTVINLRQIPSFEGMRQRTCCTIRFENGTEYEIQGVYDWNRPNWRWPQNQK